MKNTINRYLTYGCSKEFPTPIKIKKSKLNFKESKEKLLQITNIVIDENIKDPQNTIFQCSGGLDSSIIISKFENISTFCTCKSSMDDHKYSTLTSNYFKTNHQYVSEEELTKNVDIEKCLIEMNKIHSAPRGYINDLGLYLFVKNIKEQTNIITGGEGIELMYLGYSSMYMNPLYASIWYKEYDTSLAQSYLKEQNILQSKITLDPIKMLNARKQKGFENKNYFNLMNWWSTGYNNNEINNIGLESLNQPYFNIYDFVNYTFNWYGSEFYFDRRLEYADYFNVEWVSPFLDKRFIDFSLSLPIEMRNCCGQIKYIMYEALGHMVPNFIINRPKEGLVLSFQFYLERKDEIFKLVKKYLNSKNSKIYNYVEFNEVIKIINQFKIQFDFNYLRKMWMLLNLELWLLMR